MTLSYLEIFILFIIGVILAAVITVGVMKVGVRAQDRIIAKQKETINTLTSQYDKLKETTQAIIDAANACADVLWNSSFEDLDYIRKRPQPQALPNILQKPIILTPPLNPTFL